MSVRLTWLWWPLALLAGCSGEVDVLPAPNGCAEGELLACLCEDSTPSTQTCNENGGYGPCACGDPDAGPVIEDMGAEDAEIDTLRCGVGSQRPCPCAAGGESIQVCEADGTYGLCQCADAGVEAPDLCPSYCAARRTLCGDTLDDAACLAACALLPEGGAVGDTTGDTLACRLTHLQIAAVAPDDALHCRAARLDGGGTCGGSCEVYCALALHEGGPCGGLYADEASCVSACEGFAEDGRIGEGAGDTIQCRLDHLQGAILVSAAEGEADVSDRCEAAGPSGGRFCRALDDTTCDDYCDEITARCPTAYASRAACESACATFPEAPAGQGAAAARTGHTRQCRMFHSLAAVSDPEGHCPAASTDGGGTCGAPCDIYCDLVEAHCPGIYADDSRCHQACRLMSPEAPAGLRHGPNVPCRIHHAIRASVAEAPEDIAALCAHASAAGADGQGRCGECLHQQYACFGPDTFQRGSPMTQAGATDQESPHLVTLAQPFMILKSEVTQAMWNRLAPYNPSGNTECPPAVPDCNLSRYPVDGMDWYAAVAFANAVSLDEGLPHCYTPEGNPARPYDFDDAGAQTLPVWSAGYACMGYRLPTETEWEYAAKSGGKIVSYPWGNQRASCLYAAMNDEAGGGCGRQRNFEVCSFEAGLSDQGVCDMAGNVWEWTYDWGSGDYVFDDPTVPLVNPIGEEGVGDHYRVLRGGSISTDWRSVRAGHRFGVPPTQAQIDLGLRLVRTLPIDGASL